MRGPVLINERLELFFLGIERKLICFWVRLVCQIDHDKTNHLIRLVRFGVAEDGIVGRPEL